MQRDFRSLPLIPKRSSFYEAKKWAGAPYTASAQPYMAGLEDTPGVSGMAANAGTGT